MRTKLIMICMAVCLFASKAHAQFIVNDPINLAQGIINSVCQVAEASTTAANMINNFKETVKIFEQGKKYYDALKSINDLVQDAKKVQKTILMVGEIAEIYVVNFQLMLSDNNFRVEELEAIAYGYTKLLAESADLLTELKEIVNVNGLSMTDKERMDVIDRVHNSVYRYKNMVSYYTQKNISVSFLRAKKMNEGARVVALYGNANDRYW